MNSIAVPTAAEVRRIHDRIVERTDAYPGIRRHDADQFLGRVLEDARTAETVYTAAAIVIARLPRIHVFEDANKRTALTTALEIADRNGREIAPGDDELYRVMLHVARFDVEELARWLRTGTIDRSKLRDDS
jgi:death-on-curing protein